MIRKAILVNYKLTCINIINGNETSHWIVKTSKNIIPCFIKTKNKTLLVHNACVLVFLFSHDNVGFFLHFSTRMIQRRIQCARWYITHIISAYNTNIYVFDNTIYFQRASLPWLTWLTTLGLAHDYNISLIVLKVIFSEWCVALDQISESLLVHGKQIQSVDALT